MRLPLWVAPADSVAGQYTIPVAIKEKLNDETGEVETEVGGIKARSGFARAKTGAKAEKLAEDVQANLTTDPGVYSAMQNIEGKEFSPPDVFDALGNRLTWDMLTEKGTKTQFACAAVVEVQILGANKIEQKSTMSTTFLSFPTKASAVHPLAVNWRSRSATGVDGPNPQAAGVARHGAKGGRERPARSTLLNHLQDACAPSTALAASFLSPRTWRSNSLIRFVFALHWAQFARVLRGRWCLHINT